MKITRGMILVGVVPYVVTSDIVVVGYGVSADAVYTYPSTATDGIVRRCEVPERGMMLVGGGLVPYLIIEARRCQKVVRCVSSLTGASMYIPVATKELYDSEGRRLIHETSVERNDYLVQIENKKRDLG